MEESEIEKEFGMYWTKKYYVLVKSDNSFGYTIQDEEAHLFVIIERDDIIPVVINKMIKSGCKIYDSSDNLPVATVKPWASVKEWMTFLQIAKEYNLAEDDADELSRQVSGKKMKREDMIDIVKGYKDSAS